MSSDLQEHVRQKINAPTALDKKCMRKKALEDVDELDEDAKTLLN